MKRYRTSSSRRDKGVAGRCGRLAHHNHMTDDFGLYLQRSESLLFQVAELM